MIYAGYKNIEEFIYENINLEHEKYARYESASEHSSEEEIELAPVNLQDLVDAANKDPQPGKTIFIVKLIREGLNPEFIVENIRPKSNKFKLKVEMVRSYEGFELY